MPVWTYDVITVGAGPAGSYAAGELASLGYSVAVLEEKSAPGTDVCCTGIVSDECFGSFGLSEDVLLKRESLVRVHSPSGRRLRLHSDAFHACIVDRSLFDKAIASRARSRGAEYFLSCHVTDVIPGRGAVEVKAVYGGGSESFSARAVILAAGPKVRLPQKLGMGRIGSFMTGAQAEVTAEGVEEVEVYLGHRVAPGAFAWLVPVGENKALAGLLSATRAKAALQRSSLAPYFPASLTGEQPDIRQKAIPVGTLPRTYRDRVLAVGDTAGHVKPITGGGIYFGHIGAGMAVEVLADALDRDDLSAARLSRYQKLWAAKMGRELRLERWARRVFARLSDRQLEGLFEMMDSGGMAEYLLNLPDITFDWHSRFILAALRYLAGYPLRRLGRLPARGAG